MVRSQHMGTRVRSGRARLLHSSHNGLVEIN